MLKAAFLAKTDGADITASITFYTFLEFIHPPIKAIFLTECFSGFNFHVIVHADHLFQKSCLFRLEVGAIPMLLEFGGTAINADCLYIVRLQLIPNIKNIQGPLIAVTSQKPYFQIRMLSCDLCGHLFKGIPGLYRLPIRRFHLYFLW